MQEKVCADLNPNRACPLPPAMHNTPLLSRYGGTTYFFGRAGLEVASKASMRWWARNDSYLGPAD